MHYFPLPSRALHAHGVIWDIVTGIDPFPTAHFISGGSRTREGAAQRRRTELLDVWRIAIARSNDSPSQKPRVIHCYNCCGPVLDRFYHCGICENENFDLCFGCVEDGVWCGGDNHELTKRYIIDNKVCSSEAGKLSLGTAEAKYKILPEGKSVPLSFRVYHTDR